MKGKANSVNLFIYFLKPVNPGHAITELFSAICLVIKRYYKVCLAEVYKFWKKNWAIILKTAGNCYVSHRFSQNQHTPHLQIKNKR